MTVPAICYGLGYLTGVAAFAWMARRRGFTSNGVWVIMQAGLIGGLAGANLAQWLLGSSAGKTVLGGILGGWLAVDVIKRRLRFTRPTGDLFAVALCAGEAVGRLGCFFGGCCFGKVTDVPWAVWQHGAHRHPTQLYLSVASLGVLGVLIVLERSRPLVNRVFCTQGSLYCLARFSIEFWREGGELLFGLTAAQVACMLGFFYFAVRLWRLDGTHSLASPPIIAPAMEESH
jgi:phosphatidylglycerol:prolipoprotein diacylglycerol transferase